MTINNDSVSRRLLYQTPVSKVLQYMHVKKCEFRIPDRKCYTCNPFMRRCSRVIRGEYFYLWASCVCSGPDRDFISMPASCCVRFFGGWWWGAATSRRLNQLTCFLPRGLPAWPHVRSNVCLMCGFDVCIEIISSRGARVFLEAMQRKYLRGPKVCSMVFTSSAERRWAPLALIIFFKESAWEF